MFRFMVFLFFATCHDIGEAAPKDIHIHLQGLNKELSKADNLGETESGKFGLNMIFNMVKPL